MVPPYPPSPPDPLMDLKEGWVVVVPQTGTGVDSCLGLLLDPERGGGTLIG